MAAGEMFCVRLMGSAAGLNNYENQEDNSLRR